MASKTAFDASEYANDLDKISASVMPSNWPGHGRVEIHASDLTGEARAFAYRLLDRLTEKKPDADAKRLAESAILVTEKKF